MEEILLNQIVCGVTIALIILVAVSLCVAIPKPKKKDYMSLSEKLKDFIECQKPDCMYRDKDEDTNP